MTIEEKLEEMNLGSTRTGFTAGFFDSVETEQFQMSCEKLGPRCLSGAFGTKQQSELLSGSLYVRMQEPTFQEIKAPSSLYPEGLADRQCGCPCRTCIYLSLLYFFNWALGGVGPLLWYVQSVNNSTFQ